MYKLCKLIKNRDGISEIMGEILLTGIVVLFFSILGVFVFSYDKGADSPNADLQVWLNGTSDTIYLKHKGGETLSADELEIMVLVNGSEIVLSSDNVSAKLGGNESWKMGEVIEIDMWNEWGIPLENGDSVRLFLIYSPSKKVIQQMDVIAF